MESKQKGNTKKTLTLRQLKAVQMFLEGATIVEISQTVKASRKTIYEWIDQPTFSKAIEDQRSLDFERLLQKLQNLMDKAISTIDKAMDDPTITPTQLKAAGLVVDRATSVRTEIEFEKRITALENTISNRLGGQR